MPGRGIFFEKTYPFQLFTGPRKSKQKRPKTKKRHPANMLDGFAQKSAPTVPHPLPPREGAHGWNGEYVSMYSKCGRQ